ncbi:hypothetical protein GCM10010429_35150 [Micromonospora olivasterospora]|uniref:Acyl-CoA dehydrogenase-like protein n=1 Tax=Micromonospora olivasterospora TaxID=1880 RepID=A0A562I7M6_MICOL|nr:acyl-CoA dehydrogenase-like protein [Micromonospora olivasterospora]
MGRGEPRGGPVRGCPVCAGSSTAPPTATRTPGRAGPGRAAGDHDRRGGPGRVSRGAQLHHYPTRAALVTAAVTHLTERRAAELRTEAEALPAGPQRLDRVIDLLGAAFTGPLFVAALELWVAVELARLMIYKAASLYDAGRDLEAGVSANMAKYAAGEAAALAVDTAVQALGGAGMTTEYGVATLLGGVRAGRIAPVSREMILNFVAQHVLDLEKSY